MFGDGCRDGKALSLLAKERGGSGDLFANCRFSAQTSNLFLDMRGSLRVTQIAGNCEVGCAHGFIDGGV